MSDVEEAQNETEPVEQGKDGAGKDQGKQADSQADAVLQEDIEISLQLPLPDADPFWNLDEGQAQVGRKRILKIFKKKELSEDELSTLRQEAEVAPGRARVKIQMLGKKYAKNTALMMLAALCTYRMIRVSTNRKQTIEGLKAATKDAAYVLINDGISLFNCETFFVIYFDYLTKIKRHQIATFRILREGVTHKGAQKNVATALKICDGMLDEKNRVMKVLAQIKGKFKSSSYTVPWGFLDIQQAAKKVEEREYKVMCGPAEARETLIFSLALTDLFSRIPILKPLVESVINLVPDGTPAIVQRKNSIKISRMFSDLNLAIQEEDMEKKRSIGRQIFKSASEGLHRAANKPIKQSYEADPYFFISRVVLMTFGAYDADEQKVMLLTGLKAMKAAAKLDMTKNHIFTESAQALAEKLTNLMSEG